jgi:hypothetical protein
MEASISGRPIRPAAAMPAAAMAVTALVVAALILSSCAAPLVLGKAVDPLELLAPGELAYLRMDGATARLLAPAILPAGKGRSLSPLLERTSALALGLGLPTEKGPSFDAVFLGSYPYRGAAFALGGDSKWKREAQGYYEAKEGIHVSVPGPDLVLATTRELGPMLARAHGGGANPLPARFAAAAGTGLALWVPEPFSRLAEELFGMSMNVPVRGLFIVAKREEAPSKGSISAEGANAEARYEVSAIFVMDGTDAAQTYRPILRLAWYGLSRYLLEDGADALLAAKFSLEGETYASAPFELDSAQLAAAIAKLGGFGKESGAGR